MPRRPRNPTATIRDRRVEGRGWQALVRYPDPDRPDKWRQRAKTFERKAQAQAWAETAIAEHRENPDYRPSSDMSVSQLVDQWLATLPSRNLAPKTIRTYRQMARHLSEAFGVRTILQ